MFKIKRVYFKAILLTFSLINIISANNLLNIADNFFKVGEYPKAYMFYEKFLAKQVDTTKETFYAMDKMKESLFRIGIDYFEKKDFTRSSDFFWMANTDSSDIYLPLIERILSGEKIAKELINSNSIDDLEKWMLEFKDISEFTDNYSLVVHRISELKEIERKLKEEKLREKREIEEARMKEIKNDLSIFNVSLYNAEWLWSIEPDMLIGEKRFELGALVIDVEGKECDIELRFTNIEYGSFNLYQVAFHDIKNINYEKLITFMSKTLGKYKIKDPWGGKGWKQWEYRGKSIMVSNAKDLGLVVTLTDILLKEKLNTRGKRELEEEAPINTFVFNKSLYLSDSVWSITPEDIYGEDVSQKLNYLNEIGSKTLHFKAFDVHYNFFHGKLWGIEISSISLIDFSEIRGFLSNILGKPVIESKGYSKGYPYWINKGIRIWVSVSKNTGCPNIVLVYLKRHNVLVKEHIKIEEYFKKKSRY